MPFWMRRVLMAPEGEMPAAGGGAGPETPSGGDDPSPPEVDTAPDDGGAGDDPADPTPDEGGGREEAPRRSNRAGDNRVPYERVQAIVQNARRLAREEAQRELRAEIAPILQQLDPKKLRQELSVEMLRALGQEPKAPPAKYLTQEDVDKLLRERDQRYQADRQQDENRRQIERDVAVAETEMDALKRAHPDVFEHFPELEDDIANAWGSRRAVQEKLTVKQIGEKRIKALLASVGKYNKSYSERSEERQQVTPVRPQGATGAKTPKKGPDLSTPEGTKKAAIEFLKRRQAAG